LVPPMPRSRSKRQNFENPSFVEGFAYVAARPTVDPLRAPYLK
jgi:hypothetical protein